MQRKKKSFLQRLKGIFSTQLKPYLVDEKYKVIPAFQLGGVDYWMFDSSLEVPTGRTMSAMGIYMEMEMGVDKAYLTSHCNAFDKVTSDSKKININYLIQMNNNLRERTELMPRSDFIYKFASVIFFDKTESLYSYDYDYNEQKIKKWKAAGGTLDFFSRTPLKEMIPSLSMPEKDSLIYSTVSDQIAEIHLKHLTGILSENS